MTFVLTSEIPASPQRVFSVLSDLNEARQWMPAIQSIEGVSPGPFGLGTSWRERRAAGKRTMESTIRVTAYEPPSVLSLEVDAKAMRGQLRFNLTPSGRGTTVRYEAQMEGRGFMRLMTGTINRMMAQADRDLLDRLRAQVEKQG